MSKAALALLSSDESADEPVTKPSTRAIDLLEGRAELPTAPVSKTGYQPRDISTGELFGEMGRGIVGGVAHGLGTLADIVTGTGPGEGSHAELWASPFAPTTSLGQLDPAQEQFHAAATRSLDATIGTGPLAQTVRERVPQAAEAIATVVPFLKGAGAARGAARVAPEASPNAPLHAAADTNLFARESLGAAAASPDLQTVSPRIRAAVEKAAQEGPINREVFTRHIEADSLPIKLELSEGQATQHPAILSREQNARGKDQRWSEFFNRQNQQLIDNLDEIRASAAPNAVGNDHIQNGQALVDAYKAYDEPIRADITAKYKQLEDANGGQFPVNGKDFVEAADAALAKRLKGRYVPKEVAGDLADLRDGGSMTFEQFENLRTNLAAEARKADRSGDGNALAAVSIVREALETLPISGEAAAIKPLADAARSAAKARFDRMRADPAYRAAVDDSAPMGEPSVLADDFIQKHVVKGKAANIRAMRETLSADPHAAETVAAGALNYVKSKSGVDLYTNEGNFSQAGYNRALAEIRPKLDLLVSPEVAEQVQTLGNVARYTQAQPRGSFVNNSNTFVAAAGEHLASAAEGMANVAAHGIPVGTVARKKLAERAQRKSFEKATAPAAGIRMKDLLADEKKDQ